MSRYFSFDYGIIHKLFSIITTVDLLKLWDLFLIKIRVDMLAHFQHINFMEFDSFIF